MNVETTGWQYANGSPHTNETERRRRLHLLIRRLPRRVRNGVHWLLQPSVWWLRIPAGLLLVVGGFLAILPILGLWMLPLGLVLLSEDIAPLRRASARVLAWVERRHPTWMGLSPAPSLHAPRYRKENQ